MARSFGCNMPLRLLGPQGAIRDSLLSREPKLLVPRSTPTGGHTGIGYNSLPALVQFPNGGGFGYPRSIGPSTLAFCSANSAVPSKTRNPLIEVRAVSSNAGRGRIRRRERLGGLL